MLDCEGTGFILGSLCPHSNFPALFYPSPHTLPAVHREILTSQPPQLTRKLAFAMAATWPELLTSLHFCISWIPAIGPHAPPQPQVNLKPKLDMPCCAPDTAMAPQFTQGKNKVSKQSTRSEVVWSVSLSDVIPHSLPPSLGSGHTGLFAASQDTPCFTPVPRLPLSQKSPGCMSPSL